MGGVEKKNLLMEVVHVVQMKDAYVPLLLAATLWMMPYTGGRFVLLSWRPSQSLWSGPGLQNSGMPGCWPDAVSEA